MLFAKILLQHFLKYLCQWGIVEFFAFQADAFENHLNFIIRTFVLFLRGFYSENLALINVNGLIQKKNYYDKYLTQLKIKIEQKPRCKMSDVVIYRYIKLDEINLI